MDAVENFTKNQAIAWLRDLGLAVSGTKEKLITRIKKYISYPNLVDRSKGRANRNYACPCSLDPLSVPPISARWKVDHQLLPNVSQSIFINYASQK